MENIQKLKPIEELSHPGEMVVIRLEQEAVKNPDNPYTSAFFNLLLDRYFEKGHLSPEDLNGKDSRLDKYGRDDNTYRSDHFLALSTNSKQELEARGTLRVIKKNGSTTLLPIEEKFKKGFKIPIHPYGVEISELTVSRDAVPSERRLALHAMLRAALPHGIENGAKQSLAMTDDWYVNRLRKQLIPVHKITYEGDNGGEEGLVGVSFNHVALLAALRVVRGGITRIPLPEESVELIQLKRNSKYGKM